MDTSKPLLLLSKLHQPTLLSNTKGLFIYSILFVPKLTHSNVYLLRETIQTKDGGIFTLDWSLPPQGEYEEGIPTVVILHGLTGGIYFYLFLFFIFLKK